MVRIFERTARKPVFAVSIGEVNLVPLPALLGLPSTELGGPSPAPRA